MQNRPFFFMTMTSVAAFMLLDTGCRSKPKGTHGTEGVMGAGDVVEVANVMDEKGTQVSGARFEDTLQAVQGVKFAPVYFALDSYVLTPAEVSKVGQVAQHLQLNTGHVLVIEGHCDERGSNEYNLSLGENRALSVRTRLIELGIAADRIQTRSYGEEKPAVAGAGEAAWSLNRRAEFSLFQK